MTKLQSISFIIIASFFVIGGLLLVLFLKYRTGELTIDIYPDSSVYSIAGRSYSGPLMKVSLPAGRYQVDFSSEGFKKASREIFIKGNGHTSYEIFLEPSVNIAGFKDLTSEEKKQALTDYQVRVETDIFLKSYPLQKSLPYTGDIFGVDYVTNRKDTTIKTVVTLFAQDKPGEEAAKKEALSWIKTQGVNPTKLDIEYIVQAPIEVE